KVGAVAVPVASVVAVAVAPPPVNVPLAPVLGAVKGTTTPDTALPPLSVTLAANGANAEVTGRLCGVPEVAVMVAAGPAVFVREKAAAVATPETLAFTV